MTNNKVAKPFQQRIRMPLHHLERTSPLGPDQRFVGRCLRCGKEGLTWRDQGVVPCMKPEQLESD